MIKIYFDIIIFNLIIQESVSETEKKKFTTHESFLID